MQNAEMALDGRCRSLLNVFVLFFLPVGLEQLRWGCGGGPEEFLLTHLGVGCVSPVTRAGRGLAWRSQGVAWLWGGGVGRRERRRDMGGE